MACSLIQGVLQLAILKMYKLNVRQQELKIFNSFRKIKCDNCHIHSYNFEMSTSCLVVEAVLMT